jgi:hypothetical protein
MKPETQKQLEEDSVIVVVCYAITVLCVAAAVYALKWTGFFEWLFSP